MTGAIVLVGSYIAAQMVSDIASLKIAFLAGFSIDAGTFIYPVTFTIRDLIHKRLGKQAARTVVILAAAINLFMAGYFQVVTMLAPDPSWPLDAAYTAILGPVWRIVIASIIAELASELIDTEAYHYWTTKVTKRHQWSRVLVSNAISVPVDSLLFCWGAFAFALEPGVIWSIFRANLIVKGLVTLASLPGIYIVRDGTEVQDPQ